jgi:uncharacterized protein YqjF (DUF2071 family)
MHLEEAGGAIRFRSHRTHAGAPSAGFEAAWMPGEHLPEARPGTRDFFLIERYALYAADGKHLLRTRIHHHPWPLRRADVGHLASSMLESHGLPTHGDAPLAHAQAAPLHVEVWSPEVV